MHKLGLDFHGVLDLEPGLFIGLANRVHEMKGEVHIITGESLYYDGIEKKLLNLNRGVQFWDKIVSIQDELKKTVYKIGINIHGRDIYDEMSWDSFKGYYCEENEITLHIDDTLRYSEYFYTPFYYYDFHTPKNNRFVE